MKVLKIRDRWLIYDKATRIPMTAFQDALRYAGTEVDLDEVQCMLANMIDRVSFFFVDKALCVCLFETEIWLCFG